MIYHSFRASMLENRRRFLSGEITLEEADDAYDEMHEALNEQHDPTLVWEAYNRFEDDLRFMGRLEWLESSGESGLLVAWFILKFTAEAKRNRVGLLIQEFLLLDLEFTDSELFD